MAKENETTERKTNEPSVLEIATNVLVRMEGMGRENARRFLGRCNQEEVAQIAGCDCDKINCGRKVGDRFRSEFGKVMDAVLKRQEADDAKAKATSETD